MGNDEKRSQGCHCNLYFWDSARMTKSLTTDNMGIKTSFERKKDSFTRCVLVLTLVLLRHPDKRYLVSDTEPEMSETETLS